MSGFGSFVGGLFEGAQFGMNLMKARNDLEIQTMTIDAAKKAQAAADRDVAAGKPGVASGPVPNPVPVEAPPEAKPALAPDKKVEPPQQGAAVGAPSLTDKIAPIVSQHESSNRAYVGYTSPEQLARGEGWTDLSKAPSKQGDYGFPDWAGAVNPETGQLSHAAGLYQIQPDKWRAYAPTVGVNDFSPESQRKVFNAIYAAEGMKPWNANRNLMAALGQQNLLGGQTAVTTQAGPALVGPQQPGKPTSATAADPAAKAPAPATPADKAKAAQQKAAATISNAFGGGATQTAQQKTEPVMPPTTSMAEIPSVAAAPPRMAAATPAADTVGQSMVSSPQASALGVAPAPISVQPQRGTVLASMRQDSGGLNLPQPPQQRPRVFRMPNGALVDGIGNIVRPSALYPGTDNA